MMRTCPEAEFPLSGTKASALFSDGAKSSEAPRFAEQKTVFEVSVMNKILVVASAAAVMAAGMTAAQAATYKDGSYTGEGQGRASKIQVQVDVKGGKIENVKVVKHGETEMIIAAPIEQMIPEIVKKNGTEGVQTIGGATLSSKGILEAVNNALAKAK
jgi:uncharacterized protein with FMN-binding domain